MTMDRCKHQAYVHQCPFCAPTIIDSLLNERSRMLDLFEHFHRATGDILEEKRRAGPAGRPLSEVYEDCKHKPDAAEGLEPTPEGNEGVGGS